MSFLLVGSYCGERRPAKQNARTASALSRGVGRHRAVQWNDSAGERRTGSGHRKELGSCTSSLPIGLLSVIS